MTKRLLWSGMFMLLAGGLAYGFTLGSSEKNECPGTIVCPLTGEEVCKDRCPLLDTHRSDCPGKITCPLTGESVCADRCPLTEGVEATEEANRPCCRGDR